MPQDPIERLLEEHRALLREVAELRACGAELEAGDVALPAVLPRLQRAVRMLEVDLVAHARREDDGLFPVLAREVGEAGPIAVMREEHRAIHAQAGLLRDTLRELHEVQHPRIVEAGERFAGLVTAGRDAPALRAAARAIVELLDSHFAKEEQVLVPMAREVLDPAGLDEAARAMEALDAG